MGIPPIPVKIIFNPIVCTGPVKNNLGRDAAGERLGAIVFVDDATFGESVRLSVGGIVSAGVGTAIGCAVSKLIGFIVG